VVAAATEPAWRPWDYVVRGDPAWEQGDPLHPATGARTSWCPGTRAMPCCKEPSQGSQLAPPQHLGAREVSPGDSKQEGKFRLAPLLSAALRPVSWLLSVCVTAPELLPGATGSPAATRLPAATAGSGSQPRLSLLLMQTAMPTAACT